MARALPEDALRAAEAFRLAGGPRRAAPLGGGHIHDTFAVELRAPAAPRRVVLQRMNTRVFADSEAVAHNVAAVTSHLRAQLRRDGAADADRRVLRPLETREGGLLHRAPDGGIWRGFHFIEGTVSRAVADGPATAREAGRAFGEFVRRLADLPAEGLAEPLPRFHDFDHRVEQLRLAADRDRLRRLAGARRDLEATLEAAEALRDRLRGAGAATLPRRPVHNDCKLDNLLFDAATGEALCVIDLDTVMPGTLLADFGELVRTASSRAPEDERILDRIRCDPRLLEAVAKGFLSGLGDALEAAEREALPLAGALLALENAVRFLTDHLEGDVYFRIRREGHNLDRHRAQRRLARELLAAEGRIRSALGG